MTGSVSLVCYACDNSGFKSGYRPMDKRCGVSCRTECNGVGGTNMEHSSAACLAPVMLDGVDCDKHLWVARMQGWLASLPDDAQLLAGAFCELMREAFEADRAGMYLTSLSILSRAERMLAIATRSIPSSTRWGARRAGFRLIPEAAHGTHSPGLPGEAARAREVRAIPWITTRVRSVLAAYAFTAF